MQRISSTLLTLLLAAGCGSGEEAAKTAETNEESAQPTELAAPEVRAEVVSYAVDGVSLTGFVAYDENRTGPRPGVLVVHEWWGHNEYARKRAEMLAEMGYIAFALDMYGDGKLAEHPEDAQKFMMEATESLDVAVARFDAARELLEQHEMADPERTAAIGYCFGGAIVLHLARVGSDLDGVASFHGDLVARTEVEPGSIKARILVAHGADDPFVPAEQIEAFEAEMESAGADMTFIAYEGAVHSFTNPGATEVGQRFDMPLAYDPEADRASWSELESFLTDTFRSQ